MARPRKFDEQFVLNEALQVFWKRGFEATSYDDLVRATGLGRGSLAAAFGDKEGLFVRVLDHYIADRSRILDAAADTANTREALETMFMVWVEMATSNLGSCGCFLALSGVSGDAPAIARNKLLLSLNEGKKALAGLIARGQEAGEIVALGSPDRLAAFCVTLMQGVAFTARTGWTQEELRGVASEALSHLFGDTDS
jgi:AcrR family transcriptional regulator